MQMADKIITATGRIAIEFQLTEVKLSCVAIFYDNLNNQDKGSQLTIFNAAENSNITGNTNTVTTILRKLKKLLSSNDQIHKDLLLLVEKFNKKHKLFTKQLFKLYSIENDKPKILEELEAIAQVITDLQKFLVANFSYLYSNATIVKTSGVQHNYAMQNKAKQSSSKARQVGFSY
jgi:hypothetical protein